MKNKELKYIASFLLFLAVLLGSNTDSFAQKKAKTRVRAYYEKLANENKQIHVLLTTGSGKRMMGVANVDIKLTSTIDDEDVDLAIIQTDVEGSAFLQIESTYPIPRDEEGNAIINAEFAGNDTLRGANRKIKFMDLALKPSFEIEDSIKYVRISALQDSLGTMKPIEEVKIQVGVQRLYSVLFLETVETDEDGIAEMEFPDDIPGDAEGKLSFVIKVVDNDDFGTVTTKADVNWGTLVDYSYTGNGRSLFGDEAPLWMIIAVFIVLAGAWYHFVLAIIKVWQIKKLGETEKV